ncbi:helix-turn-helix domain-containing protein [Microbacterium sp. P5_E9]
MTTTDPVDWRRKPEPEPVWLNLTSASIRYDVHRNTLRRMIDRGDLSAMRIGPRGDYRLRVADLDALLTPVTGETS